MGVFEDRKQSGSLTAAWNGSGTEPANTAVTISMPASAVIYAQLDGTFSATMTWEVSVNETTFVAIAATNINSGVRAATATAAGIYAIPAAGRKVRARCSAFVSGPVGVVLSATNGTPDFVSLGGVSGGTGTVVDTELPAASNYQDAWDTATGLYPMIGAVVHGMQSGASTAARVIATASNTEGKSNILTGLLTQNFGWCLNAASTWDRIRSAAAATGTTGTGLLGTGPLLWDSVGAANFVKQAGDGSGRAIVIGAAAAGAAVAGNPVLLGVKDASGNAQYVASTLAGSTYPINVQAVNSSGAAMLAGSQATDGSNAALYYPQQLNVYNGATFDRIRNNVDVTFLASASRTTTQGPTPITTYNARAIYIVLDMTVVGTGSVTLKVDMIDPASAKQVNLLTGAAVVTNVTNIYKIGIGLTPAANATVSEYLPRTIAITVTANNANAATYSVGYSLIAA